jgi:hypothetical protein
MRRLALFAILMLSACGGDTMVGPSDILATTWRLRSIDQPGKATIVVGTPERYTLSGRPRVRVEGSALVVSSAAGTLRFTS